MSIRTSLCVEEYWELCTGVHTFPGKHYIQSCLGIFIAPINYLHDDSERSEPSHRELVS